MISVGKVIKLQEQRTKPSVPELPPPRRVRDMDLRTPVITSRNRDLPMGDAVAIYGLRELSVVARRWVRACAGRPMAENDDIALLTTELFANAVRHSRSGDPGGEVVIVVSKTGATTQVKVIDDGPKKPGHGPRIKDVDIEAGGGDLGGFGLRMVQDMSTRWGFLHHEGGRTTVWFDIDRTQER
ncbi:hypothetical protein GCM10027294_07230 [Marinactinospora endophytica]